MRKFLAALTGILYLYGFTFCLCYGAATGQVHAEAQEEQEHGECHHTDQASDQDQSHHDHDAWGSCCVKVLQDTPSLLPKTFSEPLPPLAISLHFQPFAAIGIDPGQHSLFYPSHGPPEFALRDPLASPISLRAPPLPA